MLCRAKIDAAELDILVWANVGRQLWVSIACETLTPIVTDVQDLGLLRVQIKV